MRPCHSLIGAWANDSKTEPGRISPRPDSSRGSNAEGCSLSDGFQRQRDTLTATDAKGHDALLHAAALHGVEQPRC